MPYTSIDRVGSMAHASNFSSPLVIGKDYTKPGCFVNLKIVGIAILKKRECKMAEGEGLEPPSPKAPVFKTGALPITLALREADCGEKARRGHYCTGIGM